jgi:hypothetical protein
MSRGTPPQPAASNPQIVSSWAPEQQLTWADLRQAQGPAVQSCKGVAVLTAAIVASDGFLAGRSTSARRGRDKRHCIIPTIPSFYNTATLTSGEPLPKTSIEVVRRTGNCQIDNTSEWGVCGNAILTHYRPPEMVNVTNRQILPYGARCLWLCCCVELRHPASNCCAIGTVLAFIVSM